MGAHNQKPSNPARRRFAQLALGAAASAPLVPIGRAQASVDDALHPFIPPLDAEELTSACAFCSVGCGYRIFRWPVDAQPGGMSAADNALGVSFPSLQPNQPWISSTQHNVVEYEGRLHHVVVLPDWQAEVVNPQGNHSLGGLLARRLYSPGDEAKHDRLLRPKLRVGDHLVDIEWDDALEIVARVSRHIIDNHDPIAWGLKTYSYQFYENTYAITKLAFGAVKTPSWAPHDQPRAGPSTPGLSVAGVDAFSANYEDWRDADVLLLSGVAAYEARSVLFTSWVTLSSPNGTLLDEEGNPHKALVVINPRRDVAAEWAEQRGGLHLQLRPGTDTILNNAIARVIIERGWHDEEFIANYCVTEDELVDEQNSDELRAAYGMTFGQWQMMLLEDDRYSLATAEHITGVAAKDIERAAALLAEPREDDKGEVRRPRASLMLEKGNYWSHNFPNSASLVSLGLLLGAGNRPGRVISRGGGHQRGMMQAAPYPISDPPTHTLEGRPAGLNLDQWVLEGNLRMAWVIGCTWAGGGTAAAKPLFDQMHQLTRHGGLVINEGIAFPDNSTNLDVGAVIDRLCARADAGGMVLVQQDIYLHEGGLSELADLVLPAASWGESAFTRMQGERRLRYYAKICDPPGQARPDWEIVAEIARRMGYEGFDWSSGDQLFEEAAAVSGGTQAYEALVQKAREEGRPAREFLAERGTRGWQCPLYLEEGELRETHRFHDAETASATNGARGGFKTKSGKAIFARGDWDDVVDRQALLDPEPGELRIINRRDSRTWSAMIEDQRIPFRMEQMPDHAIEINPDDARDRGIVEGDRVEVRNDAMGSAFSGVAEISDRMLAGVACVYFNYLGKVSNAANNVVSNVTDPINGMYSFKLGRGTIKKI